MMMLPHLIINNLDVALKELNDVGPNEVARRLRALLRSDNLLYVE